MIGNENQFSPEKPVDFKPALSRGKIFALSAVCIVLVLCIGYGGTAAFLHDKFTFGTVINGVDCSAKTIDEARAMLESKADGYVLTISERNDISETIAASEIDLSIDVSDGLNKIKQEQSPLKWGIYALKKYTSDTDVSISYDEEKLSLKLSSLNCLNPEAMAAPVNAKIDYNEENGCFLITPEDNGTTVNADETKSIITEAVKTLKDSISLEENGVYTNAEITSDNEALNRAADTMNQYSDVQITYIFGDETEVVDRDTIKDWLFYDENGEVYFDKDKVDEFVNYLARSYNTMGTTRSFKTSYNSHVVTVKGGDYGWWLNKKGESDSLIAAVKNGESIIKEPVYLQKAAAYGDDDIGNTYAEVNLGTQHMFFYKDGKLVFESDFVSGKPSTGHATPTGTYGITYKELDATLTGPGYSTPVKYWMPFNYDVGFHDASWQASFGGDRYLTHGSHGCINLPVSMAEKLYSLISKGDPVIVYNYVPTAADIAAAQTTTEETTTEKASETTTAQTTTAATTTTTTTTTTAQTTAKPVETTTKKQPETTTQASDTSGNQKINVVIDDVSPPMPGFN